LIINGRLSYGRGSQPSKFSKHIEQNDGTHRGGDKFAGEPVRNEMQQAKQKSAQHSPDDSDDQITDNSLAFPFDALCLYFQRRIINRPVSKPFKFTEKIFRLATVDTV